MRNSRVCNPTDFDYYRRVPGIDEVVVELDKEFADVETDVKLVRRAYVDVMPDHVETRGVGVEMVRMALNYSMLRARCFK